MIKVQDWVATIPDEEKHIAYVGEGLTEVREFLLCGKDWEKYTEYAFHLDMAFDPTSITTHDTRQVVQTTFHSEEQEDDGGPIVDTVTTKESYTVDDVKTTTHNLTDIAPLVKSVQEDGIHLTWRVLRQHTVLPGKLCATIRAVGSETGQVKKSAILVFEVDAAICAVAANVPAISEMERMIFEMDVLRMQNELLSDAATKASKTATSAATEALQSSSSAAISTMSAFDYMNSAKEAEEAAKQHADRASAAADEATDAIAVTANHVAQAESNRMQASNATNSAIDAANRAKGYLQQAVEATEEARNHSYAAYTYAEQCNHYAQLCETYADSVVPDSPSPDRLNYRHLNVRDYGAVGDGVTNDQPAIWKAFTAAKELIAQGIPCEVYFPAGTYGLLEGGMGIRLPQGKGGLLIRGAGREITTIQYLDAWSTGGKYGNGWYALDISPDGNPACGNHDTYIHDVAITGLTIRDDFPDKHATHTAKGTATEAANAESTHGIHISYCSRAAVTDCTLLNLGDKAIDIYSCKDTIVTDNHIEGCPAAGSGGGAITIADGSKGAVVSGNTITRTGADYVLTAEDFGGADGITVKAGTEMSGGIELPDGTIIEPCTKLAADTFIPVGTKILKDSVAIAVESLYTPVSDVIIADNTICDVHGKAIRLDCPNNGSRIHRTIIANNVMSGCDRGIQLSGTYSKSAVNIQNNVITDCGNGAIVATGAEDMTIHGNTFRNIGNTYAIDTGTSQKAHLLMSDNTFENIDNMAVCCGGHTIIKDCVFTGVGVAETPLTNGFSAITKASGLLTVSGCVLKDVRLKGVKGGIQNADYIEHTDIELISITGTANAGGDAIKGSATKRIIGGTMGGRVIISQHNAVVQGLSIVSTNIGGDALNINAKGVSVTGCVIITNSNYAIAEGANADYNLIANNVCKRPIKAKVGANTVITNNVTGVVTA